MRKRKLLRIVLLFHAIGGQMQLAEAEEAKTSLEERLRNQAEAAFKKPEQELRSFEYLPSYQLRQLRRLPSIARANQLRKFDAQIANDFVITHRCEHHSFSDVNTIENWEKNPLIEAKIPEVDFAPISPGNAILTFQGEVSILSEELKAEKRSVIPIVMQIQQEPKVVRISSYNGVVENNEFFAAVQIEEEASHAIVFFVNASHEPIPTQWINTDGSKVGIAIVEIDRQALVKAQVEKAKQEIVVANKQKEDATVKAEMEEKQKRLAEMDIRDWKSKTGKSWKAQFTKYDKGIVTLMTDQFESIQVKFSDLDDTSLKQLRKIIKESRLKAK